MNTPLILRGTELKKVFNRRTIFSGVTFTVRAGETLLVTGRNGSGKSTLVKIISGVLTPSGGSVELSGTSRSGETQRMIGLVSPYLQMFEEFSALENLSIAMGIRGMTFDGKAADDLLTRVALFPRRNDPVRTYSSGMKQRVKYAFALLHRPSVLILDEPMSNLDEEGVAIVRTIMEEHRKAGVLVVATNDLTDLAVYDGRVDLNAHA
jgi:heme exporter protein A